MKKKKEKVSEEELEKLLEQVYYNITVEAQPRRPDYVFNGTFAEMSNGQSGPLTEYHFFEKEGDQYPKVMIFALTRKKNGPRQLFAISDEGRFEIESFTATYFLDAENRNYSLTYS